MCRFDRFIGIAGPVGRGAAAHPQADAERRLAPAIVAVAHGRAADVLAGADQGRGSLELLERQQPQRVPHQHGHAVLAGSTFDGSLQSPQPKRVGRQAQVGFGLATARGKPEQIGQGFGILAPFGVIEFRDARQVQQDEGKLERIPRAILGDVDGPMSGFSSPRGTRSAKIECVR